MKYPEALEQWWLAEMRRLVIKGLDDKSRLDSMRRHVESLSDMFTSERPDVIGDYYKDPLRALAYGLFYFPQTFLRVEYVLQELEARGHDCFVKTGDQPLKVLDVGAGLGGSTFSLSLRTKTPTELTVMDQSASGLAYLSRIAGDLREQWSGVQFRSKICDLKKPVLWQGGPWDLVVCSFAFNEVFEFSEPSEWQEWIRHVLAKVEDGGRLIIIEPALSDTSRRLHELRNFVLEKKLAAVLAPCCHQSPCPMLAKEEIWCHEARRWDAPESLSYLDRKLFRATDALKFSFMALEKSEPHSPTDVGYDISRLVAPLRELKGRITTYGCARDGVIHSYEVQTRELSKAEKKSFLKTERGDILQWHEIKEIGDQKILRSKRASIVASLQKRAEEEQ